MDKGCVFIFCAAMWGHITPLLPVMRAFVEKGYRVRVYSREWVADKVEATGAVFVQTGDGNGPRPLRGDAFTMIVAQAETLDDFLRQEIERWQPLCAVVDTATVWGKLIAEKYGLPVVYSSPTMLMNDYTRAGYFKEYFDMVRLEAGQIEGLMETLAAKGFPKKSLNALFSVEAGDDCVAYISEAIQPFSFMPGREHIFYAGIDRQAVPPSPRLPNRWRGGARPRLYVTQGTMSSTSPWLFKNCIEAFRAWDVEVVMTVWKYVDIADLGQIPAHIHVLRVGVQRKILSECDAMICHGGLNTVADGLVTGVPMAMYPTFVDQFANAKRMEELGAGIRLADCRVDMLQSAAWRLLTVPAYRERAEALGRGLVRPNGAADAAEWILQRAAAQRG